VDNSYTLELSYQQEMMSYVNVTYDDVPLENMRGEDRDLEEVDFDIITTNEQTHLEDTEEDIEDEEEEEKEEEEEVDEDNEDKEGEEEDEIGFRDEDDDDDDY